MTLVESRGTWGRGQSEGRRAWGKEGSLGIPQAAEAGDVVAEVVVSIGVLEERSRNVGDAANGHSTRLCVSAPAQEGG